MRDRAAKFAKLLRRYRVAIWFAVALIGLDRVIASRAALWDAYDPHQYRERLARCQQGQWDLLVVGGSPAMYGIDPSILGGATWQGKPLNTAYNLGLPLGTAAEVWLAAEHGARVPPRLLVYGATATDFNEDRAEESGPRQLMTLADLEKASVEAPKMAGWYAWNFGNESVARTWQLYYHRRGIRLCLAELADRCWPGTFSADAAEARRGLATSTGLRAGNGFCTGPVVAPEERLSHRKAVGYVPDRLPFMDNYRVGAAHLASLNRLLNHAARQATPVLIVDLPVPADLDKRLYPAQFAAYRAALTSAAAAQNVPVVYATCQSVGLTDDDFCDLVHLNGDGAAKLSAWLRTVIASAGEAAR